MARAKQAMAGCQISVSPSLLLYWHSLGCLKQTTFIFQPFMRISA
jgi:hypothetical protein